jgi:fatty-acid peroxygenase
MEIPKLGFIKALWHFYKKGYRFIGDTCRELNTDIIRIKLPGLNVICLTGENGAKLFYDQSLMARKGAVPMPVQRTLTGKEAIHTTDGDVHQNRKRIFLSLLTDEAVQSLQHQFNEALVNVLSEHQKKKEIVLFTLAQQALCLAVCRWAGVPIQLNEVPKRAADFVAMVDAFGAIGPRNWKGRLARRRTERWIMRLIKKVRKSKLIAADGSALKVVAFYKDESGGILTNRLAAIELINILRPTVAISWYVVFAALALHSYPQIAASLKNKAISINHFVNELRRYYPFGPFMGAIARQDIDWDDYQIRKGSLVLLDLYGTNHDPRLWAWPDIFDPDRFRDRKIKPFDFLAQGGGNVATGHRCPGEQVTIGLTTTAIEFVQALKFEVPKQDLNYSLRRMPTLPKSGFRIRLQGYRSL